MEITARGLVGGLTDKLVAGARRLVVRVEAFGDGRLSFPKCNNSK